MLTRPRVRWDLPFASGEPVADWNGKRFGQPRRC